MKESSALQKYFFRVSLLLAFLYSCFCVVQLYDRKIVSFSEENLSKHIKFNLPFWDGWCTILEWGAPFLLCAGYVAIWTGYAKLHSILTGIMAAGFIESCFGCYGLKVFCNDIGIIFTGKCGYWHNADAQIGMYMPGYFAGWLFLALLLMGAAPWIVRHTEQCRKKVRILISLLFLFCLSEGVLFNIVYLGEYTVFYAVRNVLLLLLLFIPLKKERGREETERNQIVQVERNDTKNRKVNIWIGICFLLHMLIGTADIHLWFMQNDVDVGNIIIEGLHYLSRNYTVVLTAAASVYVLRRKHTLIGTGALAVLTSTAFLAEWYLRWTRLQYLVSTRKIIQGAAAKTGLAAWCIILYLLFTWLWKKNKKTDIIFLTILYLTAIVGSILERFGYGKIYGFIPASIGFVILYMIMFGMTIYAKMSMENDAEYERKGWKNRLVWCAFLIYGLAAAFECEISEVIPKSVKFR